MPEMVIRGPRKGIRGRGCGGVLALAILGVLNGCGSLVATGPDAGEAPGPANLPGAGAPVVAPVEPPVSETHGNPPASIPSTGSLSADPILDSPWAKAPGMADRVDDWVESFRGREANLYRVSLERKGQFEDLVSEQLKAQGLPASLAFLPVVESWYNPRAVSWVGAAGLWQFMPPTARGMGLHVDRLVDERRDPYRSTPLALAYLSELYDRFDSWFLALAAYNGGPGRLQRILRQYGPDQEGHDGLFLEILQQLPRETRDFVPRFLAAAKIGMDPEPYGFGDVVPRDSWVFDEVLVPDATSMDVIARASQVDQSTLEELNPHLLRGLTPAGVDTRVRLPLGRGVSFEEAYALIPPEERVTFLEHTVSAGETLTHIARQYGVPLADLEATNPTIRPRRMQVGQRVVVPKAPSVRAGSGGGAGNSGGAGVERLVTYRVRSGDTLSAIAVRHGVGVNDLLRWNGLSRSSIIRPGDQVKIFLPGM